MLCRVVSIYCSELKRAANRALSSATMYTSLFVLRCGTVVRLATDRSRVQIPAGPLSRNIGQLSLASLRGR